MAGLLPALGRDRLRLALALTLLAAALAVLVAPTPLGAQDNLETDATVRVVHASPGAPDVDVLVNGQPLVQALAFGAVTDYVPLPPGEHSIQIVPAGQGPEAAVVETDLDIEAGRAYIIAAVGPLNEIAAQVYEVDLDAVEPGKARVRAVHASPDAGEVDLVVTGGDELFGGVAFKDATDYEEIDAGTYSLDVRGDDDRVLVTVPDIRLQAGRVYDVFVLGQLGDQSLTLVPLVTNVSRPCTEVLGLAGGADDACLRLVHASPDAPAVDAYVNDSPVVEGLAFGTATEFVNLPPGDDRTVQIAASGADPDEAVIDTAVDLEPGQAYELVVTGPLSEIEATVAEVDLTPLPEGQARLRLIHASPDLDDVDVAIAEGENVFEGVGFRDQTDYAVIDAGAYTLQVKQGGEEMILLEADVDLQEGVVYDLIAVGRADDNTLALLTLEATAALREGGLATPEAGQATAEPVATVEGATATAEGEDTDQIDAGEDMAETAEAAPGTEPTPTSGP